MPAFNAGNIRERIEETSSVYHRLQEHTLQPTTPFRPKQTRKEIGLFNRNGRMQVCNSKGTTVPKRKYSEISMTVFPSEEVDAGDKSFFDDIGNATPKSSKMARLHIDNTSQVTPSTNRVSRFLSSITDTTLAVLSTPVIERKKFYDSIPSENASSRVKNGAVLKQISNLPTPKHSILKVSNRPSCEISESLSESFSPQKRLHSISDVLEGASFNIANAQPYIKSEDEDWLTKADSHSLTYSHNRSRESTPGKSLRFNVPKRLPPKIVDLDEQMKQEGVEDCDQKSVDSSGIIELLDDGVDNESLEITQTKKHEEGRKLVNYSPTPNKTFDDVELEMEEAVQEDSFKKEKSKYQPKHEQGFEDNCEKHEKNETSVEDIESKNNTILSLERESEAGTSAKQERDDNLSSTACVFGDISVFQTDNKSFNDTVITDGIKCIARDNIASQENIEDIECTNVEVPIFGSVQNQDKSLMVNDMSVYNPSLPEYEEKYLNATIIRKMAHEAYSQPEDVTHVEEVSFNATVKVPDISVYDSGKVKDETPVNNSIIRQMAEDAYTKPQETTKSYENKSSFDTASKVTDISVYNPTEAMKDESPERVTAIRSKAQKALCQPEATKQFGEKETAPTSHDKNLDISVYIDKEKRISPDPEVTFNLPKFDLSQTRKNSVLEKQTNPKDLSQLGQISADNREQAKSSFSSEQNLDMSVYNTKSGYESSTPNLGFLKSLAVAQFKSSNTTLDMESIKKVPSFDFSLPYEASPAAAAKRRHHSKSEKNLEISSPTFIFAEPVSSIEEEIDAKTTLDIQTSSNKEMSILKEDENLSSKEHKIAKFLFSPPVDSLATGQPYQEVDTLFHGWNRDDSPSKKRKGKPQFEFSPAESVLLSTEYQTPRKPNKSEREENITMNEPIIDISTKSGQVRVHTLALDMSCLPKNSTNKEDLSKKLLGDTESEDKAVIQVKIDNECTEGIPSSNKTQVIAVKSSPSTLKKTEHLKDKTDLNNDVPLQTSQKGIKILVWLVKTLM